MRTRAKERIIKAASEEVAKFGVPLDMYTAEVIEFDPSPTDAERYWGLVQDRRPHSGMYVEFTHRYYPERQICVTEIWADDNGTILRMGSESGQLVF